MMWGKRVQIALGTVKEAAPFSDHDKSTNLFLSVDMLQNAGAHVGKSQRPHRPKPLASSASDTAH